VRALVGAVVVVALLGSVSVAGPPIHDDAEWMGLKVLDRPIDLPRG